MARADTMNKATKIKAAQAIIDQMSNLESDLTIIALSDPDWPDDALTWGSSIGYALMKIGHLMNQEAAKVTTRRIDDDYDLAIDFDHTGITHRYTPKKVTRSSVPVCPDCLELLGRGSTADFLVCPVCEQTYEIEYRITART